MQVLAKDFSCEICWSVVWLHLAVECESCTTYKLFYRCTLNLNEEIRNSLLNKFALQAKYEEFVQLSFVRLFASLQIVWRARGWANILKIEILFKILQFWKNGSCLSNENLHRNKKWWSRINVQPSLMSSCIIRVPWGLGYIMVCWEIVSCGGWP